MTNIKTLLIAMTLTTLSACGQKPTSAYPTDTLTMRDGTQITITFFKHASLAIEVNGKHIYIDPVSSFADYATLPKADLLLITHSHADHLDSVAVDVLSTPTTQLICDSTSAQLLGKPCHIMRPGSVFSPSDYVSIQAVAAYNTSPDRLQFHPKERADNGYLLSIGGSRIYIAGDSEPTPEMLALREIDIAMLPVNQPYTMTVDQAVEAVKAIRPTIFYPYHYGEVEQKTDVERLARELEGVTEVRIRPME